MNFLRQIVSMIAVMLFTALGVVAMPFLLNASHQAEFFPHREAVVAGQIGVHFAARGPPLASTNVAFTGAAVAERGDGFVVHWHEIHAASLGFGADFDAPNTGFGVNLSDGFSSFNAFKRQYGAAGPGHAWHHVVEQTPNAGRFPAEAIHNPANIIKLPHGPGTVHNQISGFYSSKQPFTGGQTVRDWLSTKPYQEQFDFGVQTIKDFGGSQYLPPHLR